MSGKWNYFLSLKPVSLYERCIHISSHYWTKKKLVVLLQPNWLSKTKTPIPRTDCKLFPLISKNIFTNIIGHKMCEKYKAFTSNQIRLALRLKWGSVMHAQRYIWVVWVKIKHDNKTRPTDPSLQTCYSRNYFWLMHEVLMMVSLAFYIIYFRCSSMNLNLSFFLCDQLKATIPYTPLLRSVRTFSNVRVYQRPRYTHVNLISIKVRLFPKQQFSMWLSGCYTRVPF